MPSTPDNLLSDPEIATAYEDVRSDKSETTWMVLKYISGTSDALKLDSTGNGDIAEMVEHLGDDEAAYAFVRMTVGNDELSQRVKFVFVSWCGKYNFYSLPRSYTEQTSLVNFTRWFGPRHRIYAAVVLGGFDLVILYATLL